MYILREAFRREFPALSLARSVPLEGASDSTYVAMPRSLQHHLQTPPVCRPGIIERSVQLYLSPTRRFAGATLVQGIGLDYQ